jgi:hypothetical protein
MYEFSTQYYGTDVLSGIVPDNAGASLAGASYRAVRQGDSCDNVAFATLADAVTDALRQSGGSARALLDEGDGYENANAICANDMRPGWMLHSFVAGANKLGPTVRERVIVVP